MRVVKSPRSSDGEKSVADALFTDENDCQLSSCDEMLSSPRDSFSYPMRSPYSDDEDEDYAPSMTSLEESGSVTSSMDTEDLDPEKKEMDVEPREVEMAHSFSDTDVDHLDGAEKKHFVEKAFDCNDENKAKSVYYAWGDLQAAFNDTAFTRRTVEVTGEYDDVEQQKVDGGEVHGEQQTQRGLELNSRGSSVVDLGKGPWRAEAAFTLGVAGKKDTSSRRRHTLSGTTARHHSTGVAPRFPKIFNEEQDRNTRFCSATPAFTMDHTSANVEVQTEKTSLAGDDTISKLPGPHVEKSDLTFGVKQTCVPTPEFTFGKHVPPAYMKTEAAKGETSNFSNTSSPIPMRSAAASSDAVDNDFTLKKRVKPLQPNSFIGIDDIKPAKVSAQESGIPDTECNTSVRSSSPRTNSASRTPTSGTFLFGQAYKNRKPVAFAKKESSDLFHATNSVGSAYNSKASTKASGACGGTKGFVGDFKLCQTDVSSEFTAPPASFAPGVAKNSMFRHDLSRRKKASSSSVIRPPPFSASSSSHFVASLSSFKSSSTQPTAIYQRNDSTRTGDYTRDSRVQLSTTTPANISTNPFAANTCGSYAPKDLKAKTGPDTFSRSASSSSGASEDFSSVHSEHAERRPAIHCFVPGSGKAETGAQTEVPYFHHSEQSAKSVSALNTGCSFQIGSVSAQRKSRVRPRKNGTLAHKYSPRKDAKKDATKPVRSPSFSCSSSSTPSSIGIADPRKSGHTSGVDPLAAHNFRNLSSPSDGERYAVADKPTATSAFPFTTKPSVGSVDGEPTRQQGNMCDSSLFPFYSQQNKPIASELRGTIHQPVFQQNKPSDRPKTQQPGDRGTCQTCPAHAGSRRILRAAVRSIEVSKERASSAPTLTDNGPEECDAEMDSDDEPSWYELKRLGGVAHRSRKYEDAAEYYRRSIELLDSQLYRDADTFTMEIQTDKARLHANRAASLMMLMQITEAQRECRRSIEVDATYARAYLRLSRIQVLLGDTVNAKVNIDTARQLMEKQDDEVGSSDHIDRVSVVKTEGTIKELTMLQGEIKSSIECENFKQALLHTESALLLAPMYRKLQVEKARILLHRRQLDLIVKFCTSIVEKQQASQTKLPSPASASGMSTKPLKDETVDMVAIVGIDLGLLWATSLHYQNKVEDAVRVLNALEVVAPCSSLVIQLKRQWHDMEQLRLDGNRRYKEGQYQEAIRCYSEALHVDPKHLEYCTVIYCNRSAAQMGLQRYHTAILDCNEALRRKSNFSRAMLRRARCHVALKVYHEAVKDFDSYLHERSSDIPVDVMANVCRERNEAKAAIAKAREETRQREAAKKRAERQQRQTCWEDAARSKSRPYDRYRRGGRSNCGSSKSQSSGASSRASFMATKTEYRTHYEVLGIDKTATSDQVKRSYRKLALVYHPDKSKVLSHADLFKEMTAAYNVLSDKSARDKYDRELMYNKFGNFYEN
uniref:J domain-containing protein n=1 Tax=Peronospora matthiolae TaxID=2874970 RepID=A0AAV1T9I4_9STRA